MVTKTDKCSYTEYKIIPGRGTRFISKDGRVHYFISSKARSLFHQKIKPAGLQNLIQKYTNQNNAIPKNCSINRIIRILCISSTFLY